MPSSYLRSDGVCRLPLLQRRNLSLLASSLLVLNSGFPLWAQSDLIDVSQLGERGVTFAPRHETQDILRVQGILDFDGDGFDDIALRAEDAEIAGRTSEALTVVYGRLGMTGRHQVGTDTDLPRTLVFPRIGSYLTEIGPLGDLNGDGRADFFAGDANIRLPEGGRGVAWLVYGAPDLEGTHSLEEVGTVIRGTVFESTDPVHEGIGSSLVNAGDFDGDGEDDLTIGAPISSPEGRGMAGIVFVLHGSRNLPPRIDLADVGVVHGTRILGRVRPNDANGKLRGDWLGSGIAPLGDVNGDGLADVALMGQNQSIVFVILGRRSGPNVIDLDLLPPDQGGDGVVVIRGPRTARGFNFGRMGQVAGIGDMNGDGLPDIALGISRSGSSGAPGVPGLPSSVQVIHGRPDLPGFIDFDALPPAIGLRIYDADRGFFGEALGQSVAAAGDLNLDGLTDFLINKRGEAYAIFGRNDFPAEVFLADGLDGMHILGNFWVTGPAGDFNGDGAAELLLPSNSGTYLIYGTGGAGAPLTLLSVRPETGPLQGGTTVVLRGSGFRGTPAVRFAGKPAGGIEVLSGSALRLATPAGLNLGRVDVSVTVDGVTRTLGDAFEYTPDDLPVIDLGALGAKGCVIEGGTLWKVSEAAAVGDVTGDGVDDLALGLLQSGNALLPWQVFLLHGGSALPERLVVPEPGPGRTVVSSSDSQRSGGFNLATMGDVNGDGIGDLGIAPGRALGYILWGRPSLPEKLDIDAESLAGRAVKLASDGFQRGFVFAPLGDLTGDGLADFALGLGEAQNLPPNAGEVLFVRGSRDLPELIELTTSPLVFSRINGFEGQRFGTTLASVGDINGDGYTELLVGGGENVSTTHLLYLRRAMPPEIDLDLFLATELGVEFYFIPRRTAPFSQVRVAAPGDVNRDGRSDLLFGREFGGGENRGMTFLVPGSLDLPPALTIDEEPIQPHDPDGIVRLVGERANVQSGHKSGPVGDFNGDGFDDFVVGQHGWPPGQPGSFCLILGGPALPEWIDLGRLGGVGVRIAAREAFTGTSVPAARTGDLNGDGATDMVLAEAEGGTSPGAVYIVFGEGRKFVRGDANDDELLEITDGILVLSHLFLGDTSPICGDGADTDDDGRILITDAIYLLTHLFLAGPPPPAPYPDPGLDPTRDGLDCQMF